MNGDADDVADLLEAAVYVQFMFTGNDAKSGQVGQANETVPECKYLALFCSS